jgi:cobalt-zinc-cadmium efflux system outer membrane protein
MSARHHLLRAVALLGLCTWASAVLGQSAGPSLTLTQLEAQALESHPAIQVAAASARAAASAGTQAGRWDNPVVESTVEGLGRQRQATVSGLQVAQQFPVSGQYARRASAARAEADVATRRIDRVRRQISRDVRTAYVHVLAAEQRRTVRARLAELARQAVTVTEQLFNTGAADRPDVLAAQIEATSAALGLVEADNRLARDWLRLGVSAGQPALSRQPISADQVVLALPEGREAALQQALAESPDLQVARAALTAAEREREAQQRAQAPMLTVSAGLAQEPDRLAPPDLWTWSARTGLTVPLWNRNTAGVAAATSRIAAQRAQIAALELRLTDRFAVHYERYATAQRQVQALERDLLPKSEQAYRLYLDRYRAMAASYPQVLFSQRALFQTSEIYVDAVETLRLAALRLMLLIDEDEAEAP